MEAFMDDFRGGVAVALAGDWVGDDHDVGDQGWPASEYMGALLTSDLLRYIGPIVWDRAQRAQGRRLTGRRVSNYYYGTPNCRRSFCRRGETNRHPLQPDSKR
jgi:hypothetical protein